MARSKIVITRDPSFDWLVELTLFSRTGAIDVVLVGRSGTLWSALHELLEVLRRWKLEVREDNHRVYSELMEEV